MSSDGYTSAGGIGINAVSAATAGAAVDNSVTQSNTNSLTASTQGDLGLIAQSQEALQANVNLQLLAAASEAISGNVAVESEGDTDAGGHGIIAVSAAVAGASVDSTVTQSNTNSASATTAGDLTAILQIQELLQANANLQAAAAIAVASSGSVTVDQRGSLSSGGNGITATSSAIAGASLNQSATQGNTNSATATLTAPSSDAAIQAQLAAQINLNEQDGAAIAAATSSFVEVRSTEDPSVGNGIIATSSAVAGANLSQTADQTNTNSATTTLPPLQVVGNDVKVRVPLQVAAQLEGVLQANVNDQDGLAIATATSDYVLVEQGGPLSAGIDGVTATSSAVAGASLTQSADQSNTDTKTITRAAGPAPGEDERLVHPETIALQLEGVLQINASSQEGLAVATADAGSVEVNSHDDLTATGNGITATSSAVAGANLEQTVTQSNTNSESATGAAILQLQLVGQANFNEQEGAAIAAATSDYVSVDQSGVLTAGGNGITATSSAVAGANLDQTATQSNSNSATATLEAPDGVIVVEVGRTEIPLRDVGVQAQLVGQLNVNDQDGAAIATAASSYVEVRSFEDPSQGDGIIATSSAVAGANLDQTANQSNTNSASITLPALPVVPALRSCQLLGLRSRLRSKGCCRPM